MIYRLIFVLLFTTFLSADIDSGSRRNTFKGPITITGTTSEINSTTGQDLYLNKTTTGQKTIITGYKNGSSSFTTLCNSLESLLIENNDTCTGSTQIEYPPPLIFKGHGWDGSADKIYELGFGLLPSNNDLPTFSLFMRKGGTGSWSSPFSVNYDGHLSTFKRYQTNIGETLTETDWFVNGSAATDTVDQYSQFFKMCGRGWKTDSTAGSQFMSCGFLVAPEQGAASPIGVFKWCYGTNTTTPLEANEILRLEWGDRLGAILNSVDAAGYIFDYSKAKTVKPQIYTQATEPDIANDSTAFWKDSDDGKVYQIIDVGGTQTKFTSA